MKVFLFSDLHCSLKNLARMRDFVMENKEIKALVFTGDVVNMGEPVWVMEKFIETIGQIGLPLLWVPGNNDFGRAYYKLNAKYKSLEGRVLRLKINSTAHTSDPLVFTGVGGSPASWAGQYAGEHMIDKKLIGGSIFLSHVPPPGVHTWQKFDLTVPTSEKKFADSPLVHICGHVHYQWGCAYLGQTKVIKLASLEVGYYAIMDLNNLEVNFGRF